MWSNLEMRRRGKMGQITIVLGEVGKYLCVCLRKFAQYLHNYNNSCENHRVLGY